MPMSRNYKKKRIGKIDYGFADEIAALESGRDILKCIQCGTCTASCAVAEHVEGFSPRKIIAKALLGLEDDVLSSDEIWYCARCQYCVANCKKDIRPGDIITAIRTIAIKEGKKETAGARHTLAFLGDLRKKGKLDEAMLPIKTLGLRAFKLIPYAVRMLSKGKVPMPIFKTIDGMDEIRQLIEDFED